MNYDAIKTELLSIGFVKESEHHPEGESFGLDKDGVEIHACISYPFIETWSHQGFSGIRYWYKSIGDIKNIVDQIIKDETHHSNNAK